MKHSYRNYVKQYFFICTRITKEINILNINENLLSGTSFNLSFPLATRYFIFCNIIIFNKLYSILNKRRPCYLSNDILYYFLYITFAIVNEGLNTD